LIELADRPSKICEVGEVGILMNMFKNWIYNNNNWNEEQNKIVISSRIVYSNNVWRSIEIVIEVSLGLSIIKWVHCM